MTDVHRMPIKEIKELLQQEPLDMQLLHALSGDSRQGVRQLLEQVEKRLERKRMQEEQWLNMTVHERHLRQEGCRWIAGVDEVGRGPLAGPVVTAAVILPEDFYLPGLNDSKKVSPALRESYYEVIVREAVSFAVIFADAETIDQLNIYQATLQAMRDSIGKLEVTPDITLVDGLQVADFPTRQLALVGGDGRSVSIAAASIVAKVTRDRWMAEAAQQYPMYGFERNAGYGTPEHLAAIARYGPSPIHRKSFAGVKEWVKQA